MSGPNGSNNEASSTTRARAALSKIMSQRFNKRSAGLLAVLILLPVSGAVFAYANGSDKAVNNNQAATSTDIEMFSGFNDLNDHDTQEVKVEQQQSSEVHMGSESSVSVESNVSTSTEGSTTTHGTEVRVNGELIEVPAGESLHKVVPNEDGTGETEIKVNSSGEGSSSINIRSSN